MDLLRFRIIGHPLLPDAAWIETGPGLNILQTKRNAQAQALVRMLATVNPPFDPAFGDPFAMLPQSTRWQQHTRRILPAKKTAAIALYGASPSLVEVLAAIDPVFYETGWVEVGRRRDYSRWMNFVELSGATRWSELAPEIFGLLPLVKAEAPGMAATLRDYFATWRGSDRIQGERALELRAQLRCLVSLLPEGERHRLAPCLQAVGRFERFQAAKELAATRLPLFLSLPAPSHEPTATASLFDWFAARLRTVQPEGIAAEAMLDQVNQRLAVLHPEWPLRYTMQGSTLFLEDGRTLTPQCFAALPPTAELTALATGLIAMHEVIYGCPPILLIETHHWALSPQDRLDLLAILRRLSSTCQCLVAPDPELLDLCTTISAEETAQPWLRLIDTAVAAPPATHP